MVIGDRRRARQNSKYDMLRRGDMKAVYNPPAPAAVEPVVSEGVFSEYSAPVINPTPYTPPPTPDRVEAVGSHHNVPKIPGGWRSQLSSEDLAEVENNFGPTGPQAPTGGGPIFDETTPTGVGASEDMDGFDDAYDEPGYTAPYTPAPYTPPTYTAPAPSPEPTPPPAPAPKPKSAIRIALEEGATKAKAPVQNFMPSTPASSGWTSGGWE